MANLAMLALSLVATAAVLLVPRSATVGSNEKTGASSDEAQTRREGGGSR
ncbi:hypothetical protein [Saccharopolyspora dendranthemae]|uniref:Uncharacterized protein n=1 Tax=Saccharopolyspora dendranthemae TaxID=1181886 RepID=A0A561U5M6_9PSEU|nr:hypothetical protein [Saccharopolyspora dendranthemae]TWF94672.1 hypothetical protein FHU35_13388 [Saccharopolyspora dendranthemae]